MFYSKSLRIIQYLGKGRYSSIDDDDDDVIINDTDDDYYDDDDNHDDVDNDYTYPLRIMVRCNYPIYLYSFHALQIQQQRLLLDFFSQHYQVFRQVVGCNDITIMIIIMLIDYDNDDQSFQHIYEFYITTPQGLLL